MSSKCPSCDRRRLASSHKMNAKWDQLATAICPPCYSKFHGPTEAAPPKKSCAGCGRKVAVGGPDTCERCKANNVEPLSLLDL